MIERRYAIVWLMAVTLAALVTACGGGGNDGPANTTGSSAKAVTAYSLAGITGTIDETAKTITVTMPYGTNVTALVATFTTTGASVKVGATTQTSGTTANDFTSPVSYTVTATDGTAATYTVTVTVALNSAKAITAYSLAGVTGTINEAAKTIAVTMPYGTNVTALVATFTTTGASAKVGATTQASGTTANDFTGPVSYTVTAADGTTAIYTVTVMVALNSAKAITAYSLAGVTGTIDEAAKTIAISMPYGTNVTALVATFTTTGASVKVGATAQTSGATANDFTNPVSYTVTAADSTTATYTVTATVASGAGVTWTARTSGTTNILYAVACSSTICVAVGGPDAASPYPATILTSPDGITWTSRSSGAANIALYGVTWANSLSKFVAVGVSGTILTSPDGVTWTAQKSGTVGNLRGVSWSGSMLVAVISDNANGILSSPDGITWTLRSSPGATGNPLYGVNGECGSFHAVGAYGTHAYSPDGVTWYQYATVGGSVNAYSLNGVSCTGSTYTGAGAAIATLAYSSTVRMVPAAGTVLRAVVWTGAQHVAVGSVGLGTGTAAEVDTSPDGINWTTRTSSATTGLFGVAWNGTRLIAVGAAGIIFTSE